MTIPSGQTGRAEPSGVETNGAVPIGPNGPNGPNGPDRRDAAMAVDARAPVGARAVPAQRAIDAHEADRATQQARARAGLLQAILAWFVRLVRALARAAGATVRFAGEVGRAVLRGSAQGAGEQHDGAESRASAAEPRSQLEPTAAWRANDPARSQPAGEGSRTSPALAAASSTQAEAAGAAQDLQARIEVLAQYLESQALASGAVTALAVKTIVGEIARFERERQQRLQSLEQAFEALLDRAASESGHPADGLRALLDIGQAAPPVVAEHWDDLRESHLKAQQARAMAGQVSDLGKALVRAVARLHKPELAELARRELQDQAGLQLEADERPEPAPAEPNAREVPGATAAGRDVAIAPNNADTKKTRTPAIISQGTQTTNPERQVQTIRRAATSLIQRRGKGEGFDASLVDLVGLVDRADMVEPERPRT